METHDLRCTECGTGRISAVAGRSGKNSSGASSSEATSSGATSCRAATGDVVRGAYVCEACQASFDEVWGVPFLGRYESTEIFGLVEIAANIVNRGKFGVTPAVVAEWEALLSQYHAAPDKAAFIANAPGAKSPYLLNRYGEWIEVHTLLEGVDLAGRHVLDLGAGLGFDAHRLWEKGAKVTALEFSPVLAEWGAANFPDIRWIGGLADVLPFRDGSFDAVFCNAALHHFRDIPASIAESLRVLRPGGLLITTCDSFRSDAADDLAEARIFDRDPAVLLGVNERVPRFREFAETYRAHRAALDVDVYTHTLYNAPRPGGGSTTLTELTRWDLDRDGAMLAQGGGSLAWKATLREKLALPARTTTSGVLSAADFVGTLSSQTAALAALSPLVPQALVNLPFPGSVGQASKFELLNGWRLAGEHPSSRRAYRRGRWFLRRNSSQARPSQDNPSQETISFEVRLAGAAGGPAQNISVLVNGVMAGSHAVGHDAWTRFEVDLRAVPVETTFALEIRSASASDDLDAAGFDVRNRVFLAGDGAKPAPMGSALRRQTSRLIHIAKAVARRVKRMGA
jgi:SAM-dependent methyltransferase